MEKVYIDKVWITKYALTKGISTREHVLVCSGINDDMIVATEGHYQSYYHKPEWHETEESAIARAEEMRLKKIQSLEKQIEKLRKVKFQ